MDVCTVRQNVKFEEFNTFHYDYCTYYDYTIPVVITPANTQHCPYLTGFLSFKNLRKINELPIHSVGAVPPSKSRVQLPIMAPLSSWAFTWKSQTLEYTVHK